jgi:hypothetical protein
VKPLCSCSIIPPKKICLRTVKPAAQADCGIGESLFYDRFNRAIVDAGAAIYADISIDDVLFVALGDCLNGALISASAALNTSISNLVSHDFSS